MSQIKQALLSLVRWTALATSAALMTGVLLVNNQQISAVGTGMTALITLIFIVAQFTFVLDLIQSNGRVAQTGSAAP